MSKVKVNYGMSNGKVIIVLARISKVNYSISKDKVNYSISKGKIN